MNCPFCGGEMTQNTVGLTITLFCKNSKCDRAGVLYSPETIKDAQKCAGLQKKLDKAMTFLKGFERAEQFGALAQEFRDVIKEIEDI